MKRNIGTVNNDNKKRTFVKESRIGEGKEREEEREESLCDSQEIKRGE
jgi:hypothetical protein